MRSLFPGGHANSSGYGHFKLLHLPVADYRGSPAWLNAHALRDTFGTQSSADKVSVDVVRKVGGHVSLQTSTCRPKSSACSKRSLDTPRDVQWTTPRDSFISAAVRNACIRFRLGDAISIAWPAEHLLPFQPLYLICQTTYLSDARGLKLVTRAWLLTRRPSTNLTAP